MAKRFIDINPEDNHSTITENDGAALTLTNTVRVLYDPAVTPIARILLALQRAGEALLRINRA